MQAHDDGKFWFARGLRRAPIAEPAASQPDSATVEPSQSEPVQPLAVLESKRDWAKYATAIIAGCALVATTGSCVAAWEAWRTSRSAERIAQHQLDVAGGDIVIDQLLDGDAGGCADGDSTFQIKMHVSNRGHLAAQLLFEVHIGIHNQPDGSESFAVGELPESQRDDGVSIPAQTAHTLTVPIRCEVTEYKQLDPEVVYSASGGPEQMVKIPAENVFILCKYPDYPDSESICRGTK